MACADPEEVKRLFDAIEDEVRPQIQPFYVTECPRGYTGTWFDRKSGERAAVDPACLQPEDRKQFRNEGPEIIYTFWSKHGPCRRPD